METEMKNAKQTNKAEQKKVVAEYKKALSALHAYSCDSADDPTYLKLNGAANEASGEAAVLAPLSTRPTRVTPRRVQAPRRPGRTNPFA
jgi:hypothetical protein